MTYYLSQKLDCDFPTAIERIRASLQEEGFGVLSDIDIQGTLKAKIGADFRPYRILGACNPPLARDALNAESHIGVMLPCNVVVQDRGAEGVEVSAIDPVTAMAGVNNSAIEPVAHAVRQKLQSALEQAAMGWSDD